MRYIFRFYKRYDLDLLVLSLSQSVSFTKLIKSALRAYIRGQDFSIVIQQGESIIIPKSKAVTIDFTQEDEDVINWLNSIVSGQRCTAVKCILRHYIQNPITDVFFTETENTQELQRKTTIKQERKREVYSGNIQQTAKQRQSTQQPKQSVNQANEYSGQDNRNVSSNNKQNPKGNFEKSKKKQGYSQNNEFSSQGENIQVESKREDTRKTSDDRLFDILDGLMEY